MYAIVVSNGMPTKYGEIGNILPLESLQKVEKIKSFKVERFDTEQEMVSAYKRLLVQAAISRTYDSRYAAEWGIDDISKFLNFQNNEQ